MHLRCTVCAAVQSVNTADVEDEDPRTQGIRRSFRAEHLASCGDGSVSLELHPIEAITVDPHLWTRYLEDVQPPPDVQVGADGFFTRHGQRVCEDCWQTIPAYVDFPDGLTSPESDGPRVPKLRPETVATDSPLRAAAAAHLPKAVCLPCYLEAFARVYPQAARPMLNDAVLGEVAA